MGERVGRNVATFRRELAQRSHELIPERELALGLVARLAPVAAIAGQRSALAARAAVAGRRLARLRSHLEDRIAALSSEEAEQRELCGREQEAALEARREAAGQERCAAALRRFAAESRHRKAVEELERERRAHEEAQRESQLWEAAVPLYNALRHEHQARLYQEQLARKQEEFAPLLTELRAAAGALAGALQHRLLSLRRREEEDRRKEREAREEAGESRARQAEAGARSAGAQVEIRRLEEMIEAARAEREELATRGVIAGDETGAAALERLRLEIAELDRRATVLAREAATARQRQAELREEREAAALEARAAGERAAAEQRRLEEATAVRRALEEKQVLRALLEVESVDLERLSDRALVQLRDAAHAVLERIVALRIERAEDERALAHLEDTDLLPPSRDAQKVLDRLRSRLPAAWSGWAYIEANAPADEEARRRLIQQHAPLATGVIVRDSDFDKACELLELDPQAVPEAPVTIAPAGALSRESAPPEGKVIGPASRAYYDRAEGRTERMRRRLRFEAAERTIGREEDQRQEIEFLANRLHEFRQQYPRGWFTEQDAIVQRERQAQAGWDRRAGQLAADISRLEEETGALEGRARAAEDSSLRQRSARELVAQFVRQYESRLGERRSELESWRRERVAAELDQARWGAEAARLDRLAAAASEAAREMAIDAGRIENQLSAVEYADLPVEGAPGPIDALKDRYAQLKAEYENKIEAKDLLRLCQAAMEQAAAERRKLQSLLPPGTDEVAVRAALDSLGDPSSVDARCRKAQLDFNAAFSRHGQQANAEKHARAELEEAVRVADALGGVPDLTAEGAPEADEQAAQAEQRQRRLEGEASQHEERARGAGRRIEECASQARGLRKDQQHLETVQANSQELLTVLEPAAPDGEDAGWTVPAADEECEGRIAALDLELRQARAECARLDSERQQRATEIRAWAQRPGWPKAGIAARLASAGEPELETNAAVWGEELEVRVQAIAALLKEIDQHRDLLIDETLVAAEQALSLLHAAHTCSRLPDHVPGLGGAQFLRIRHHAPEETGERRGRIGALIDDLVDAGEIPPGLALVQQAVRRLAKPIRVKVLHPDPDLRQQAVDIVDLARFSGGEQLTAAILLYCSLAQLRARSRGFGRGSSSVLILDNPIGRASRVRFLELQREVARAMGVQLFYTTGVNDLEALRTLPNVIRVRNSRIDRNTGHHFLEHDDTQLEPARIVREEG